MNVQQLLKSVFNYFFIESNIYDHSAVHCVNAACFFESVGCVLIYLVQIDTGKCSEGGFIIERTASVE